jgi:hypothetical protein
LSGQVWWLVVGILLLASCAEAFRRRQSPKRPVTPADLAQVKDLARRGEHLRAMRLYRKLSNASLRAKEVVEGFEQEPSTS